MRSIRTAVLILASVATFAVAAEADDGGLADDQAVQVAAQRARGEARLEAAAAAEAAGRYRAALGHYRAARAAMGEDERARRGVVRMRRQLGDQPPPAADLEVADEVRAQLVGVEVRVALQRAERLAEEEDFAAAREALALARVRAEEYPDAVDGAEIEEIERRLADMRLAADDQRADAYRRERIERQRQARARTRQELGRERSRRDARIARVVSLKQRGHYQLAVAQARDLVSDFPGDRVVETLFGELLHLSHEQRRLSTEERMAELELELHERVRRSMIPEGFDGRPRFPADWHQTQERRATLEDRAALPEWELEMRDRLAGRVDVAFEDTAAAEAFEMVAADVGLNLVIDPELRAAVGGRVTLQARGMRVDHVFNFLARQANTEWALRNEAVWVGGAAAVETVTEAYDVSEFIFTPGDFAAQPIGDLGAGAEDGADFDLFGGAGGLEDEEGGLAPEELADLIRVAVMPETWNNPEHRIVLRGDWMLITTTTRIQALVREFMRSQALANNILVRIKLDWLELSDRYIEEIGVDWSNTARAVIQGPFTSGLTGFESEHAHRGSVSNQLPATAVNLGDAAVGNGLMLQYANLALPAVQAMLRANQTKSKARRLDGIELTALNGARSSAFFGEQTAYIADYEASAGGNLNPVIDVVNTGQAIEIRPHVSADRKYVSLNLRPTIAAVDFFTERIAVAPLVGRGGGDFLVNDLVLLPIELPNVQVRSAGTRVMIPDQGTVLVGGIGDAIEQSSEAQVPLLGHIPFLGRLFGMRGRYSVKSQLYLTVSARIILYDEEEANL